MPCLSAPVQVGRPEELLTAWSEKNHVYLVGSSPLDSAQAAELDRWLGAKYPNWTVVLSNDVRNFRYTDLDGRALVADEALEYFLGQKLARKFTVVHPETKSAYGAVFALTLNPRSLIYISPDTHDQYQLSGEEHWQGNLDQPAVRAMRNGGNVMEAARGVISNIESALAGRIAQRKNQAEARRREAEERKRQFELRIGTAKLSLEALRQEAAAVLGRTEIHGVLTEPPIDSLQIRLDQIARSGEQQALDLFEGQIRSWRNELAGLDAGRTELSRLQAERAKMAPDAALDQALSDAGQSVERAEPGYSSRLKTAATELESVQVRREMEREAAVAAKHLREMTLLALGFAAAFATLILAWVAHRRLQPFRTEAFDTLNRWRKALEGKGSGLLELLNTFQFQVGRVDEIRSALTGYTQERALAIAAKIDALFISLKRMDDNVGAAAGVLESANPFQIVVRQFFRRPYFRAMSQLSSGPIEINPSGLNPSLEKMLLGKPADYLPFTTTLAQTSAEFDTVAAECMEFLKQFAAAGEQWQTTLERARQVDDRPLQMRDRIEQETRFLEEHVNDPMGEGAAGAAALAHSLDICSRFKLCEEGLEKLRTIELKVEGKPLTWAQQSLEMLSESSEILLDSFHLDNDTRDTLIAALEKRTTEAGAKFQAAAVLLGNLEGHQERIGVLKEKLRSESLRLSPNLGTQVGPRLDNTAQGYLSRIKECLLLGAVDTAEENNSEFVRETAEVEELLNSLAESPGLEEMQLSQAQSAWESARSHHDETLTRVHSLRESYNPEVLELSTVTDGNHTAADNDLESQTALDSASKHLAAAAAALQAKDILVTREHLEAATRFTVGVENRYEEARSLEEYLIAQAAKAQEHEKQFQVLSGQAQQQIASPVTDELTAQHLQSALDEFAASAVLPRNPPSWEKLRYDQLLTLQKGLHEAANDAETAAASRDAVNKLDRTLQSTRRLDAGLPEAARSSVRLQELADQIAEFTEKVRHRQKSWDETWGSLQALSGTLFQISAETGRRSQEADQAMEAISSAQRKVDSAARWSGRYARVVGNPGAGAVEFARELFAAGKFAEAAAQARAGEAEAARAIARAEEEESRERRRREEEERERRRERERREEAARRSRRSSSFSSSSSRSSSSHSSGGSRSSFRSGSGGGRSSW